MRTWGSTTIDSLFLLFLLFFIYLFIYFLKLANQVWKQLFVFIIIYFLIFRFCCFNLDIFVISYYFRFFLLLIIYFILFYFVKSPPFLFESFSFVMEKFKFYLVFIIIIILRILKLINIFLCYY